MKNIPGFFLALPFSLPIGPLEKAAHISFALN
jgi:hypothetical protein